MSLNGNTLCVNKCIRNMPPFNNQHDSRDDITIDVTIKDCFKIMDI